MLNNFTKTFKFFNDIDKFNKFSVNYKLNFDFLTKQLNYDYKGKRVLAIYDFADSPYTADIAVFIVNAEIERRKYNLEKVDIIFISNDKYPCNPTYQIINNHKQLIYNFAIEFTRIFDFIGSVSILDNRQLANNFIKSVKKDYMLFPKDYDIKYPFERFIDLKTTTYYATNYSKFANLDLSLKCVSAPLDQLRLARKWLLKYCYPKIPITITLRETELIEPKRTSNKKEWQKLINSYNSCFKFIILRDYYKLYDDEPFVGDNVVYCDEAVVSLSFRTALLELTTLNLMIANGTSIVSLLSTKINYLHFKAITNYPGSITLGFYQEYYGFDKGDNWFLSTKYQKFIWEDDNFDVLKRETDKMLTILEEDGRLYPECYKDAYTYTAENIKINKEIYKQPSLISQRVPLKYYVYTFKIIKLVRKIFNIDIPSIDDITLNAGHTIVLYGAGTVSENIIKRYRDNICFIVDKNYDKIHNNNLNGIDILSIDRLKDIEYDYLVITPKLREYSIIKELRQNYKIPKSKFLLGTKY